MLERVVLHLVEQLVDAGHRLPAAVGSRIARVSSRSPATNSVGADLRANRVGQMRASVSAAPRAAVVDHAELVELDDADCVRLSACSGIASWFRRCTNPCD